MKAINLIVIAAVLGIGGAIWVGRTAWRAHRGIVSLNVRNAPLNQVLRSIEWQTWKKLRAEKSLDARITLHVKDAPLDSVLNRICEQAGARWSRLYAVYGSTRALSQLEAALQGDGELKPAGWTLVAPKATDFDQPEPGLEPPKLLEGPEPGLAGPGMPRERIMIRKAPDGQIFIRGGGDHGTEIWSPEQLVVESSLETRLGAEEPQRASADTAAETARKVGGKWTTCLAIKKSVMGIGFGGPPQAGGGMDPFKSGPSERYANLTPQQRVLQARQRFGFHDEKVIRTSK